MAKIFAPVLQMSQVSLYECTRTHVSSGTNLWNLIHKEVIIFIQEKVCENVVCKISILFKPQIWSAKYWPFCWNLNVWMKLKTKKKHHVNGTVYWRKTAYDTKARCECYFLHDDVIKWKHFPRYWPFVRGIHQSPVNYPHKDQWRGALMFSLICVWINSWVNNREAGDLRRHRAHYNATVMIIHNSTG